MANPGARSLKRYSGGGGSAAPPRLEFRSYHHATSRRDAPAIHIRVGTDATSDGRPDQLASSRHQQG